MTLATEPAPWVSAWARRMSTPINNGFGDLIDPTRCEWGGCKLPADYVVGFAVTQHDGTPVTVERRPLCTRHADEHCASWHTTNPHDPRRAPTTSTRTRIRPY
jgi:hypothetical protein